MDTRTTTDEFDVSIPAKNLERANIAISTEIRTAYRQQRHHPYVVRWPYASVYPRFEVSPPEDASGCPYCGHEHEETRYA